MIKEDKDLDGIIPKVDLKFIIVHKETGAEIEMPVLGICEEYTHISFSTKNGAYDDAYNEIMGLQDTGDQTAEHYYVFVEINRVRHLYDGLFLNKDRSETKRK